jgi:hypothetical protein
LSCFATTPHIVNLDNTEFCQRKIKAGCNDWDSTFLQVVQVFQVIGATGSYKKKAFHMLLLQEAQKFWLFQRIAARAAKHKEVAVFMRFNLCPSNHLGEPVIRKIRGNQPKGISPVGCQAACNGKGVIT